MATAGDPTPSNPGLGQQGDHPPWVLKLGLGFPKFFFGPLRESTLRPRRFKGKHTSHRQMRSLPHIHRHRAPLEGQGVRASVLWRKQAPPHSPEANLTAKHSPACSGVAVPPVGVSPLPEYE